MTKKYYFLRLFISFLLIICFTKISAEPKHLAMENRDNVSREASLSKGINETTSNTLYHLQNQPDNYFTLQLLGSSNYKAIQKVINEHRIHKELFFHKNQRGGKDWFTLFYGSYVTKDKALKSYEKLPKSLKLVSPWVRNIKVLKKQLINNYDRQDVNDVMQMLNN